MKKEACRLAIWLLLFAGWGTLYAQNCKQEVDKGAAVPSIDYNDKCELFQLIGGLEQGGASSLPSQTNGFLSAFTRVGTYAFRPWARIRLLGAPTGSTGDVVAAFQDPSGALKSLPQSKIGQAVDFTVGVEYQPGQVGKQYTIALLAEGGATTPLSSQDVVNKFAVPAGNSPECAVLANQFSEANGFPAGLILLNPNHAQAGAPCLQNGITVLAFNPQQRDSFLRKYAVGIRTTFRYIDKITNAKDQYSCCELGMVDFTVGQDEAITGGHLHHWVFRIDAVHPLGVGNALGYLYLFGTAAIRLQHNNFPNTLILQSDTTNALPSDPNVALLPLQQPDKDFYRFGLGLDIKKIFTKLFE